MNQFLVNIPLYGNTASLTSTIFKRYYQIIGVHQNHDFQQYVKFVKILELFQYYNLHFRTLFKNTKFTSVTKFLKNKFFRLNVEIHTVLEILNGQNDFCQKLRAQKFFK